MSSVSPPIVKHFNQPLTTRDFNSKASEAKENERPVVGTDKHGHTTLKNEKLGIIGSTMRKLGTYNLTKDWSFVKNYNKKLDAQAENTLNHLVSALKNTYTQRGAYQAIGLKERNAQAFKGTDFHKNIISNLTTTALSYEKVYIKPNTKQLVNVHRQLLNEGVKLRNTGQNKYFG